MTPALAAQGFALMVYGMGTVIVFLAVLVFAVRLMSWVVHRWFAEPVLASAVDVAGAASGSRTDPASAQSSSIDPEILAVIAAAVHAHRQSGSSNS